MDRWTKAACTGLLAWLGITGGAQAEIQIVGTRVIYPASEREVTVNVLNNGKSPRLLQVWTDDGDPADTATTSRAPFLATPPLSRIEPGKGQALRLMFTGNPADLPQDRESVFWLNVLEIPPRPKSGDGEGENFLQFAVRTRLKIFFRPKGLQGDPLGSLDQLRWRAVSSGNKAALECTNASAYNVSFADVRATRTASSKMPVGGMCPARGQERFPIEGALPDTGTLFYTAINDYGGFVERQATYSP